MVARSIGLVPQEPASLQRVTLFVGRVSLDVNERQLRAVFDSFGVVRSCKLIPDQDPSSVRQHKGFGFVTFEVCVGTRCCWASTWFIMAGFGSSCSHCAAKTRAPCIPPLPSPSLVGPHCPGLHACDV